MVLFKFPSPVFSNSEGIFVNVVLLLIIILLFSNESIIS